MKKKYKIYIIALLLFSMGNVYAQTEEQLEQKLSYTQKDYFAFMRKSKNYGGFSVFYDLQNFPNAANKHWMSNMQSIGLDCRALWYPLLFNSGVRWKYFGKINSPYQIPAFQSAKLNKNELGGFVSLSVFPLPYIPALKRTQEYVSPYIGIGYQWESLNSWAFNSYDVGYYQLNLSSWYWKVGCNIFLGDFPLDLFAEYSHTLNSDKIRNYEWIRIGITLRYMDLFKNISGSKKSFSKSLIQAK
jgi:hypothetical protein